MPKTRFATTKELTPHPLLERVAMMAGLAAHFEKKAKKAGKNRDEHKERAAELQGDWQAMVQSVKDHGVLEPLKVCKDPETGRLLIVDGRNRWLAAKEAKRLRVPYFLVAFKDAARIIMDSVAARRHYSKGSTAYLACLMHPEFSNAGQGKRTDLTSALNAEVLSTRFAVSVRLLEQASKLYRLLEAHPRFRVDAEADVWAGVGLGGIIAGVESLIATGKRAKPNAAEQRALAAWRWTNKACAQLGGAWGKWADLAAEQRDLAVEKLKETLHAAPEEVRALLKALP